MLYADLVPFSGTLQHRAKVVNSWPGQSLERACYRHHLVPQAPLLRRPSFRRDNTFANYAKLTEG